MTVIVAMVAAAVCVVVVVGVLAWSLVSLSRLQKRTMTELLAAAMCLQEPTTRAIIADALVRPPMRTPLRGGMQATAAEKTPQYRAGVTFVEGATPPRTPARA